MYNKGMKKFRIYFVDKEYKICGQGSSLCSRVFEDTSEWEAKDNFIKSHWSYEFVSIAEEYDTV
jgi:hypothetical protein